MNHMTVADLREIAAESGLHHAEFCLEQDESQFGRDDELRAELNRLLRADGDEHAASCPAEGE